VERHFAGQMSEEQARVPAEVFGAIRTSLGD
jgi:hypothetical protein